MIFNFTIPANPDSNVAGKWTMTRSSHRFFHVLMTGGLPTLESSPSVNFHDPKHGMECFFLQKLSDKPNKDSIVQDVQVVKQLGHLDWFWNIAQLCLFAWMAFQSQYVFFLMCQTYHSARVDWKIPWLSDH